MLEFNQIDIAKAQGMGGLLMADVTRHAEPERVRASGWFGPGSKPDRKYVETDDSQILVFDAAVAFP
jgi:hypothetical protein